MDDATNLDLATAAYREQPPLGHGLSQLGRGAYDHEGLVRKVKDFIHKYTRDDAVTTLVEREACNVFVVAVKHTRSRRLGFYAPSGQIICRFMRNIGGLQGHTGSLQKFQAYYVR